MANTYKWLSLANLEYLVKSIKNKLVSSSSENNAVTLKSDGFFVDGSILKNFSLDTNKNLLYNNNEISIKEYLYENASTAPTNNKNLWVRTTDNTLMYYSSTQKDWVPLGIEIVIDAAAPSNTNKLWLDIGDTTKPILKWFDGLNWAASNKAEISQLSGNVIEEKSDGIYVATTTFVDYGSREW